ncbi:FimB/Mfa2 family fimbrial subunit [Parabacteroides faecis]|uniref:FimB/Mfa2 family fimbrial subunit n=1 Tax=Parabacteroides TaxID=375288 RepID=UPI000F0001EB|nr:MULTISPECIES: FimB/Mfa2 family fimbrial subunit [Parabacteroides]MBC8618103.1 FimB/Mfa2 family fimbrial subunit [Parabacteroides faecis]RHR99153.1 hypothetical protein DWW23_07520 [Parabacteroides sp. AF14-59]
MNKMVEIAYLLLAVVLCGCTFGDEPGVCPYTTRLDYWYAGNSSENMLPVYVDNLRQYLFDERGDLLSVVTLRGDTIRSWQGNLEEGDYTVVLWGNLAEDGSDDLDVQPLTDRHLADMTLSAVTAEAPPAYRRNTGRLYYGYLSFHVEEGKMFRRRVYLSHAHASLHVTVQWMADAPPEGGTYRMRMKGLASEYGFMKGWESEPFTSGGSYTVPYIGTSEISHETRAAMSYDGEVIGDFVTFRYTSDTHQLWSLWRNDECIIGDLDLHRFFSKKPMNMDRNVEQEFEILVTVYEDKIIVSEITDSDWDEGGAIG